MINSISGLDEYQEAANKTDQNPKPGFDGFAFPLLGLFGEVGTLASALKKRQRDRDSYLRYTEDVLEDFGDVLWYFTNLASRSRLQLSTVAKMGRLPGDNSTFRELDKSGSKASLDSPEFEKAVLELSGCVGLLLNDFSLDKLGSKADLLPHSLADIFHSLVRAANASGISLQEAAAANLRKIESRWPTHATYSELFDEEFDEIEQLPRNIEMQIIEKNAGGRTYVIQRCNGINIGARLTDNKVSLDDYRFHDVFHLAYAAILGWSPVIRALFNVKRKSKPKIDETEDGARAILIEEGVSTLVFNYALRLNYLESVSSLDYPLLKTIRGFVEGYEVARCPLWQWEKAVLDGFAVFRHLRTHRSGLVTADLKARSISVAQIPS